MRAPSTDRLVRDEMLSSPAVHSPELTFGELRELFRDDHLHMAVLVDDDRLVAALERSDLGSQPDDAPARSVGVPDGRTVAPGAPLDATADAMRRDGRRRLAVVDDAGSLLGLLCLKADASGFCSDRGVQRRRDD